MKQHNRYIALSFAFALFLAGCSDDGETPVTTATLAVRLTDAPGDYEQVNITFDEVSAHINSGWTVLSSDTMNVDLLEWNNGTSILLGRAEVAAGTVSQIRLRIVAATVKVNGALYPMEVPSGAQSGLKLNAHAELEAGIQYELIIDFDAERSVKTTAPDTYKLDPVIRVIENAVSGSIQALVRNPQDSPLATVYNTNGDVVATTRVDTQSGTMVLAYLPEGVYRIVIEDAKGRTFELNTVAVKTGKSTDLGEIVLG